MDAVMDWTRVIFHPLGLAGFVLFLLFGYLAKAKTRGERRWLVSAAVLLSVLALTGGLWLAYFQLQSDDRERRDSGGANPHRHQYKKNGRPEHIPKPSNGKGECEGPGKEQLCGELP